ncbi:MAG: hypothetical protein ACE5JI_12565 [Acidobacteriota bacterium]
MQDPRTRTRTELYRLLLSEEAGVACNLVPRMLADPDSLTPEIRWCLLYLVRGIRNIAARNGLLGNGDLLDTVVEDFEISRRRNEHLDWLWFAVVRDDENHWVQRYQSTDIRYSLEELHWLHQHLGRVWSVERERLVLEEPPLPPLVLREKLRLKAASEGTPLRVSGSLS